LSAQDKPTLVTIYGKTYHLRGDDPGYLHELAREVDGRMREVAEATGTADTLNVAILAALKHRRRMSSGPKRLPSHEGGVARGPTHSPDRRRARRSGLPTGPCRHGTGGWNRVTT
jgi:hypothetical protein